MTSEAVLYNITGNKNLANTHVDEIAAIVKEYPFFSPAQFLLALKQKRDSSYNYEYQLQKTSLYFSNQAWLNYLITEKEVAVPDLQLVDAIPAIETTKEAVEENIFPTSLLGSNNFLNKSIEQHEETLVEETDVFPEFKYTSEKKDNPFDYNSLFSNKENKIEVPTLDVVKQIYDGKQALASVDDNNEIPSNFTVEYTSGLDRSLEFNTPYFPNILNEPIAEISKTKLNDFSFDIQSEEKRDSLISIKDELSSENFEASKHSDKNYIADKKEEASSIFVSMPSQYTNEELPIDEKNDQVIIPTHLDLIKKESQFSHLSIQDEKSPVSENNEDLFIDAANEASKTITSPISNIIPSYSFKGFSDSLPIKSEVQNTLSDAVSISEAYANNNTEEEADNTEYVNNISSMISNQVEDFKKPIEDNAKLEFENEHHHHTIDYFASQGIKIDLTKVTQDKLTLQMRRFTDWLKQIKKQDPNPQDLGTDPELEKAIMNIAKTSIEAREIVTETMADVFIKQGKVNKAIQLYIKLSFLDPQKSTYFANKIQQLKGI